MGKVRLRRRRWRMIRATLRDARLLLRDSWPWLMILIVVWFGFGGLIWRFYDRLRPSFDEAMYLAFSQMTLNPVPAPRAVWLQAVFYVAPALNLVLVARGALNIGLLVFDKRNRREAWQMALASTYRDHVIVCGLGKIGYRVVTQLQANGTDVVVIDNRPDGPF